MRHPTTAAALAPLVLLVLSAGGCGTGGVVLDGAPVASPYDGPMSAPVSHADQAGVRERSGAAALALECDGRPWDGGGADYDSGLAEVADSPDAALSTWFDQDPVGHLPTTGYRAERADGDRVLLSYDVGERTRVAVVVHDGVRDFRGETGWGVEAWAQCDVSELPAEVSDALGLEVWTDADGRRVPTDRVGSRPGPEHCDWQDITFLETGGREYLRDVDGELAALTAGRFAADATLPAGARDTGWLRDGRRLWLAGDAAYLVSTEEPEDVERWPASTEPIGCA